MELFTRFRFDRLFKSLLERIQKLPRRPRKGANAFLRRGLGVGLLLLGWVLASWAQDLAREQAVGNWLQQHPPSVTIWKHALQSSGFHEVSESSQLHKALRNLPTLSDTDPTAWVTADHRWIAIFTQEDDGAAPRVFCLECQGAPTDWEPAGTGWEAFEPLLKQADRARALLQASSPAPAKKPSEARDPREIVY